MGEHRPLPQFRHSCQKFRCVVLLLVLQFQIFVVDTQGLRHEDINYLDNEIVPNYYNYLTGANAGRASSQIVTDRHLTIRELSRHGSSSDCFATGGDVLDIVFLIDGSMSIQEGNFTKTLEFVSNVVQQLDIGPTKTQIGLTEFNGHEWPQFHLNSFKTKDEVIARIKHSNYLSGVTSTGKAIRFVVEEEFTGHNGDRPEAPNVIIIVTDGRAQDDVGGAVASARSANIDTFSVGVTQLIDNDQLLEMAGRRADHRFLAQDFENFNSVIQSLTAALKRQDQYCARVNATTPATTTATIIAATSPYQSTTAGIITGSTTGRQPEVTPSTSSYASSTTAATTSAQVPLDDGLRKRNATYPNVASSQSTQSVYETTESTKATTGAYTGLLGTYPAAHATETTTASIATPTTPAAQAAPSTTTTYQGLNTPPPVQPVYNTPGTPATPSSTRDGGYLITAATNVAAAAHTASTTPSPPATFAQSQYTPAAQTPAITASSTTQVQTTPTTQAQITSSTTQTTTRPTERVTQPTVGTPTTTASPAPPPTTPPAQENPYLAPPLETATPLRETPSTATTTTVQQTSRPAPVTQPQTEATTTTSAYRQPPQTEATTTTTAYRQPPQTETTTTTTAYRQPPQTEATTTTTAYRQPQQPDTPQQITQGPTPYVAAQGETTATTTTSTSATTASTTVRYVPVIVTAATEPPQTPPSTSTRATVAQQPYQATPAASPATTSTAQPVLITAAPPAGQTSSTQLPYHATAPTEAQTTAAVTAQATTQHAAYGQTTAVPEASTTSGDYEEYEDEEGSGEVEEETTTARPAASTHAPTTASTATAAHTQAVLANATTAHPAATATAYASTGAHVATSETRGSTQKPAVTAGPIGAGTGVSASGDVWIDCGQEDITISAQTKNPFYGKVYAKGHFNDPACRGDYSNAVNSTTIVLKVNFNKCGGERIRSTNPKGLFMSLTIIYMFHPQFETNIDKAYNVQCFFQEADKAVTQQLDVEMLTTTATLVGQIELPACDYSVRSNSQSGPIVKFARIGDNVFHRWECEAPHGAEGIYGMKVHSCFVKGGGNSTTLLVDEVGCAMDKYILKNLVYSDNLLLAYAPSQVFKLPDSNDLYFDCQIAVCIRGEGGTCEGQTPPKCGELRKGKRSVTVTLLNGESPRIDVRSHRLNIIDPYEIPFGLDDTLPNYASQTQTDGASFASFNAASQTFCFSSAAVAICAALFLSALLLVIVIVTVLVVRHRRRMAASSPVSSVKQMDEEHLSECSEGIAGQDSGSDYVDTSETV